MKWANIKERLKKERGRKFEFGQSLVVGSLRADWGGFWFWHLQWPKLEGLGSSNCLFILVNTFLSIKSFVLFAVFLVKTGGVPNSLYFSCFTFLQNYKKEKIIKCYLLYLLDLRCVFSGVSAFWYNRKNNKCKRCRR